MRPGAVGQAPGLVAVQLDGAQPGMLRGGQLSGGVVGERGLGPVGVADGDLAAISVVFPVQLQVAGAFGGQPSEGVPGQLVTQTRLLDSDRSAEQVTLDIDLDGLTGAVAGDPSGLVVGPADLVAGRVELAGQPAGWVVFPAGHPAELVGAGHQPADLVVAVFDDPAQRVSDLGEPAAGVVAVASDAAVGVDALHELTARVVAEPGHAAGRVGDLGEPPGGVVGVAGHAAALAAAGGQPASIVVAKPLGLSGWGDNPGNPAFGVVAVGPPVAEWIDLGHHPPGPVVLEGDGMRQRAGHPGQSPGGGVGIAGDPPQRIGDRGATPAPIVGGLQLGAIWAAVHDSAAQLVELELHRRDPVVDFGDPAQLVDGGAAVCPQRVDAADQVAVGVVLAQPARPGRVMDTHQAAQRVVGVLPLGAVGSDHPD